jgi:hypothetical protein
MSVLVGALKPLWMQKKKSATLAGGATPAIADYDGDFKDDLATFSPDGTWTISLSGGGVLTQMWGGALGDIPVPADYDATANPKCDLDTSPASCHNADLAVWNNSTGNWTISNGNGSARTVQWGQSGDIPIPR